jgi:endonuclease YncB( thermonuclease family)
LSPASRLLGLGVTLAVIGLLWLATTWLGPSPASVVGRAMAVDGDTLRIGQVRIRLTGLDAPELDQTCVSPDGASWECGSQARTFLSGLLKRGDAVCIPSGRDRYRRVLARCTIDRADVGEELVGAGWAVSASLDFFDAEQSARASHLGIWSGTFEAPADWRRNHGEGGLWDWLRSWFE